MSGARRLATSSSALLGILAIIAIVAMGIYGRIEGQSAVDFVKWIVIAYFTKVAVEDGAAKLGKTNDTPAPVEAASAATATQADEKS